MGAAIRVPWTHSSIFFSSDLLNFAYSFCIKCDWLINDLLLQYSTSDIYVSWESFTDVEEYKTSVHSYGIKEYHIGIGMYIYINIYIIEPS